MKIDDLIKQSYILKNIVRYNNHFRLTNESVAEHSYFVTLYVLLLYEEFDFDLTSALSYALIHDIPEIHTGDIGHEIKQKFSKLKEVLDKIEIDFIGSIEQLVDIHENLKFSERDIVKLADIKSVILYLETEIKLGNKSFQRMLEYSIERHNTLYEKLKSIRRHNDN